MLSGIIATVLHARLKVPMHLPGKQGLLYMFIIMSAVLMSGMRFSALIASSGTALLLLTGFGSFGDIFMPVNYLVVGLITDLLLQASPNRNNALLTGLAGGIAFSAIPLMRAAFSLISGAIFPSLFNGLLFPFATHLLFGFAGSFLAAVAIATIDNK